MAKTEETVKKTTRVTLMVEGNNSTIIRGQGLPMILDQTERAVTWLANQGFKVPEIELIGEKPSNWDQVFEPPVAA